MATRKEKIRARVLLDDDDADAAAMLMSILKGEGRGGDPVPMVMGDAVTQEELDRSPWMGALPSDWDSAGAGYRPPSPPSDNEWETSPPPQVKKGIPVTAYSCRRCMKGASDQLILPCTHIALCEACANDLPAHPRCPYCSREIDKIIPTEQVGLAHRIQDKHDRVRDRELMWTERAPVGPKQRGGITRVRKAPPATLKAPPLIRADATAHLDPPPQLKRADATAHLESPATLRGPPLVRADATAHLESPVKRRAGPRVRMFVAPGEGGGGGLVPSKHAFTADMDAMAQVLAMTPI